MREIRYSRRERLARLPARFCLSFSSLVLLTFSFCLPTAAQRSTARHPGAVAHSPTNNVVDLTPAARAALDAAVAALQANSPGEAERQARVAVGAAPRSAVTHNVLGVVLDRAGRSEEAVREFNAAIKLDPNFVSARNNVGRVLAEHGKSAEAIA